LIEQDSFIKVSNGFVKLIKNKRIDKYDMLVSFDSYYEQISGVAMGSSLSPIVTNLYMEYFKRKVLDSYPLKPTW